MGHSLCPKAVVVEMANHCSIREVFPNAAPSPLPDLQISQTQVRKGVALPLISEAQQKVCVAHVVDTTLCIQPNCLRFDPQAVSLSVFDQFNKVIPYDFTTR